MTLISWDLVADGWKYVAIISTGAFASVGLLTEVRNKRTKRLTKWGKISLFGLLFTAVGGLLAAVAEQQINSKRAEEQRAYQAGLLESLSKTLHNVERILTPVGNPGFNAVFDLDCEAKALSAFCQAVFDDLSKFATNSLPSPDSQFLVPPEAHYWNIQLNRQQPHGIIIPTNRAWDLWPGPKPLSFKWAVIGTKGQDRQQLFLKGQGGVPDFSYSLSSPMDAVHAVAIAGLREKRIALTLVPSSPPVFIPSGSIVSLLDFSDVHLTLYDLNNDITNFRPAFVNIITQQGRILRVDGKLFSSTALILPNQGRMTALTATLPAKIELP